MTMPLIIQKKVLAGLDRQIEMTLTDPKLDEMEGWGTLVDLCLAPWHVAEMFEQPYAEIADLMDRYSLKPVTRSWNYEEYADPPDIPNWNKGFHEERVVPLYSPLGVFNAWSRWKDGDVGVKPPPVRSGVDEVLRSIWREWSFPYENINFLCANAHDAELIGAALSADSYTKNPIFPIAKENEIWIVKGWLGLDQRTGYASGYFYPSGARRTKHHGELEEEEKQYCEQYSESPLRELRKVFDLDAIRFAPDCTWLSPSIIPLVESLEEFQDRTNHPKWLLYKAVTVYAGQLPEAEHNRMLAEAVNHDKYAESYCDFLNTGPESAPPEKID